MRNLTLAIEDEVLMHKADVGLGFDGSRQDRLLLGQDRVAGEVGGDRFQPHRPAVGGSAGGVAGRDDGCGIELVDDRRPHQARADIELFALIDRAIQSETVEARFSDLSQRVSYRPSLPLVFAHLHRRHAADAPQAV